MASSKKMEVEDTDLYGFIRHFPRAFGSPVKQSTCNSGTMKEKVSPNIGGKENLPPSKVGKGHKENIISAAVRTLKPLSGYRISISPPKQTSPNPLKRARTNLISIRPPKQASENQMSVKPRKRARTNQRVISPLKRLSADQMLDKGLVAKREERIRTTLRWMQQQEEKWNEKERQKMEKEREEREDERKMEEQRQTEQRQWLMEEGRRLMEERQKAEDLDLNLERLLHNGLPNWAEIPIHALSIIFEKLGAVEFCNSSQVVCRSWRYLPLVSPLPPYIDMRNLSTACYYLNPEKLARRAIDCTRGPIEYLHIESVSDAFLTHIADRCFNLRCFSLIRCSRVSSKMLIDFLGRCPMLEELNMYQCSSLRETFRHIGRVCPQIKRLSVNASYNNESNILDSDSDYRRLKKSKKWDGVYDDWDTSDPDSDEDLNSEFDEENFLSPGDKIATEIAKDTPQLRELRIMRDLTLTNKGVHAILDNCLYLEALDLRCCYKVRVDSVLHAKLDKIKNVKFSRRSVLVLNRKLGKQVYA